MREGLVSIIIPVYNRAALLADAVQSALSQTYRPIEIIIVDDGSTDDTPSFIESLVASHSEITALSQPNGGPGVARETGRGAASGEFIQYLDSDDLLLPEKLELQVGALRARPDAGVAYGRTRYLGPDGSEIKCTWKNPDRIVDHMLPSFIVERWWETATPLYRRTISDAAGPWLATRLEEDWEYDCRVGALATRLAYVREYVAIHRQHGGPRLSVGEVLAPARLRDRTTAHLAIVGHAGAIGLGPAQPEVQHFARDMFHLARQCGAAGLTRESRELLRAAAIISGAWDITVYRCFAALIGSDRLPRLLRLVGLE